MKITDVRATTVAIPLEAPLRYAQGVHPGRLIRTLVEVDTDEGVTGLGEIGGSGASSDALIAALRDRVLGHDPMSSERLRWVAYNPVEGAFYEDLTQGFAAIEFACLDLQGRELGVPVHALLGGKVRDRVPFASYLFFRHPADDGTGEIRTPDQLVAHARSLVDEHGFSVHKLKGGVFPPDYERECFRALAEAFPGHRVRFDPNGAFGVEEAIRFARGIEDLDNDYLEDPTWGLNGMRRVRENTPIPLATNTVVVNFEQLAANVRDPAVDVILLDTTFWGGLRPCVKAAGVCETFQLGVAVHSSGELGIQLATMLHLGAVVPNLSFAADAHYHHLRDDIIAGGKLPYADGAIAVPDAPGLGVELDRDKLAEYAELFRELGPYPYDRDPARPDWYPLLPNTDWADPS